MSVYLPSSFAVRDSESIARLIEAYPFAALITASGDQPQISHVPLLYRADPGPRGSLIGHVARANPHWQRFTEAPTLAVFSGPHAYVSPSWYADPPAMVPTWNYVVAHVYGSAVPLVDRAETLAVLREMTERFESRRPRAWRLQLEGARLEAMVGAIVAFRMIIERVDAKFKLSQNRSVEDRERVIAALLEEGSTEASATAEWMIRYAREG
jgi:transcriptional regulator